MLIVKMLNFSVQNAPKSNNNKNYCYIGHNRFSMNFFPLLKIDWASTLFRLSFLVYVWLLVFSFILVWLLSFFLNFYLQCQICLSVKFLCPSVILKILPNSFFVYLKRGFYVVRVFYLTHHVLSDHCLVLYGY